MKLTAEQVADGLCRAAGIAIAAGKNNVATGMLSAMELIRDNLIESPDERRKRFAEWYRDTFGEASTFLSSGESQLAWLAWNAALDFGG